MFLRSAGGAMYTGKKDVTWSKLARAVNFRAHLTLLDI